MLRSNNITQNNSVSIDINFGQLKTVMEWCRSNCHGNWSLSDLYGSQYAHPAHTTCTTWVFSFEDERDQILFGLRWKS